MSVYLRYLLYLVTKVKWRVCRMFLVKGLMSCGSCRLRGDISGTLCVFLLITQIALQESGVGCWDSKDLMS